MSTYMYIDVETTGLGKAEIVQLSYIKSNDYGIFKHYDEYFKIKGAVEVGALEVHGLSFRKLEGIGKRYFEDFIPELMEELDTVDYIVGHNVLFDIRKMKEYMNRDLNIKLSHIKTQCTQRGYMSMYSKEITSDNGVRKNSFVTLNEVLSILINRYDYNLKDIYSTYKMVTGREPKLHDSMFDIYITQLAHAEALRQGA